MHRVLIVDDDPDFRRFLAISLEELGYQACEAASGEEALELLHCERFEAVLLDLRMPGMGGEEVARRLEGQPSPRVVLLTAAPAHEVTPVLRNGAHYYLPKGATQEQLSLLLDSIHA